MDLADGECTHEWHKPGWYVEYWRKPDRPSEKGKCAWSTEPSPFGLSAQVRLRGAPVTVQPLTRISARLL
jgi:hypothetical protein